MPQVRRDVTLAQSRLRIRNTYLKLVPENNEGGWGGAATGD